jgi:hypothetical protein
MIAKGAAGRYRVNEYFEAQGSSSTVRTVKTMICRGASPNAIRQVHHWSSRVVRQQERRAREEAAGGPLGWSSRIS